MIQLKHECLYFNCDGGSYPLDATHVTIELIGEACEMIGVEKICKCAGSVVTFFKCELGRDTVTVAEFSAALARELEKEGYQVLCNETVKNMEFPPEKERKPRPYRPRYKHAKMPKTFKFPSQ